MTSSTGNLKHTPLHALHEELGGRMVPFAGYAMPVHYKAGILKEHLHTRAKAGLFDVSHMGQAHLGGDVAALEQLTPADVMGLKDGHQRYGLLLTEDGTIKDDFMFARLPGEAGLFLVVNAATKESDYAHIEAMLGSAVRLEQGFNRALLALQGPCAAAVLERHAPGVFDMAFMQIARTKVAGAPAVVSRTGYTGEDGYEISLNNDDAERVARVLLGEEDVLPIGLGARDSLRLEAGLCLYGHDIDESTGPVEAGLAWSIGKRRREAPTFLSGEKIMTALARGTARKRVGLRLEGRAPAREDAPIAAKDGRVIGRVTSGGFGPSVNGPIAMGYVESAFSHEGSEVDLIVRGQPLPARTVPMPFVPHKYHRLKQH